MAREVGFIGQRDDELGRLWTVSAAFHVVGNWGGGSYVNIWHSFSAQCIYAGFELV